MLTFIRYFCYIYTFVTFIPFAVLAIGVVLAAWENKRNDD